MADSKISDDPEATNLTGAYLAGIQGGTNKKFPSSLLTPVTPINLAQHSVAIGSLGAQTLAPGDLRKVTNLTVADWNPNSYWSIASQRFQPLQQGLYTIAAKATLTQLTDGQRMVVFVGKNGTNDSFMMGRGVSGGSSQPTGFGGTYSVVMNGTTDYLEMYVFHSNATDTDLQSDARYTTFSASYVGPTL